MDIKKAPEYFDLYEMAGYYSDLLRNREHLKKPDKPNEKDFKSHAAYGQALDEYELYISKTYRAEIVAYNKQTTEIENAFKQELLSRLEISKHPKAERLYEIAWENGHSGGLSDVVIYAEEMAELLK